MIQFTIPVDRYDEFIREASESIVLDNAAQLIRQMLVNLARSWWFGATIRSLVKQVRQLCGLDIAQSVEQWLRALEAKYAKLPASAPAGRQSTTLAHTSSATTSATNQKPEHGEADCDYSHPRVAKSQCIGQFPRSAMSKEVSKTKERLNPKSPKPAFVPPQRRIDSRGNAHSLRGCRSPNCPPRASSAQQNQRATLEFSKWQ